MLGLNNRILVVDLTNRKHSEKPIPHPLESSLGGRGLASSLLYHYLTGSRESDSVPLIYSPGYLTGIGVTIPGATRTTVSSISPLTGFLGDGSSGGDIGHSLKGLGYDALIITGSLNSPGYLEIQSNALRFHRADNLWGLSTFETVQKLKTIYSKSSVSCIGPAGENGVLFSTIMNEPQRFVARCGLGAVLGRKKLKAIVFNTEEQECQIEIADESRMAKILRKTESQVSPLQRQHFVKVGTLNLVDVLYHLGRIPAKYWSTVEIEHIERIAPERIVEAKRMLPSCCSNASSCYLLCTKSYAHEDGNTRRGPEYEAVGSFGAQCYLSDPSQIIELNDFCNRSGMDAISAGNAISFFMFCSRKKLLPHRAEWGDYNLVRQMLQEISNGEGEFARILSRGVKGIAEGYPQTAKYAVTSKGLEWENSELRKSIGGFLAHIVSSRGGDHLRGMPTCEIFARRLNIEHRERTWVIGSAESYKNKHILVIEYENHKVLVDSLGICYFHALYPYFGNTTIYYPEDMLAIIQAVSGKAVTNRFLDEIGNRTITIERHINIMRGLSKTDDNPPKRFLRKSRMGQVNERKLVRSLRSYYRERGWDQEGVPAEPHSSELGLV